LTCLFSAAESFPPLSVRSALPDPVSCLRGESKRDKHARDSDGIKKTIHDFSPYEGSYFKCAFIRLNQNPRPEVSVRWINSASAKSRN
jgi:hypothetical protein